MSHIEKGMNWYKETSQRLQKEADYITSELDNVQQKIKDLETQKLYFTSNLKIELKRNRVLESEIHGFNTLRQSLQAGQQMTSTSLMSSDFDSLEFQGGGDAYLDSLADDPVKPTVLVPSRSPSRQSNKPSSSSGLRLSPVQRVEIRPSSRLGSAGLASASEYSTELDHFNQSR
jgi:hypothetical protein